MRRAQVAASMFALAFLFPAAPASAQEAQEDHQVVLTGEVNIEEGRTVDSVVIFDGPATVEGVVEGSVVAFNGDVTISGSVGNDVVVFNGAVTVRSGAEISGDLLTREAAVVEDGAVVRGEIRRRVWDLAREPFPFLARLAVWVAVSASMLLLGLLLVLLFPRLMDATVLAWATGMGGSIGWGLILLVGLPLLGILFLITIVGIPLGVGLLLALALLYATGYVVGGWILGRQLIKPPGARALAVLVGILLLRLIALIPVLGGLVGTLATVLGLGAIAVASWRAGRLVPEEGARV